MFAKIVCFLKHNKHYLLPCLVALLAMWVLKDYFVPRIQIILGIMAAPFVFKIEAKGITSYRYLLISILFLVLYYWLHISVMLFFSIGCLLFFSIESRVGKIGILPFLFLICISPALHYLVNMFTFSIRLELSKYAAILLNMCGNTIVNKGSYFVFPNGKSYSVDTACIGLNMFNTGLSITLLLVGFAQQNLKRCITIYGLMIVFVSTFVLLIVSNLFRIIGLVVFKSEAGTISHDAIGMACLIVYTTIPVYFLIQHITRTYGIAIITNTTTTKHTKLHLALILSMSFIILYVQHNVKQVMLHTIKDVKITNLILPTYSKRYGQDGVVEFIRNNVLIYVKPANKAYQSDHSPAICWKSSGFLIQEISECKRGEFTFFKAKLTQNKTSQYTAWWYDNGVNKTISQWQWRLAKGEPYRIINITCTNEAELNILVNKFLNKKLF